MTTSTKMNQSTKMDNTQTVEIEQNGENIYQVDFFLIFNFSNFFIIIFLGTKDNNTHITTSTKMSHTTAMDNRQTMEIEQNGENIYQVDFFFNF